MIATLHANSISENYQGTTIPLECDAKSEQDSITYFEYYGVCDNFSINYRIQTAYVIIIRNQTRPDTLIPNVYDPQSLNRYMFERGNAYNKVDPTGHWLFVVGLAIIGIAIYHGYKLAEKIEALDKLQNGKFTTTDYLMAFLGVAEIVYPGGKEEMTEFAQEAFKFQTVPLYEGYFDKRIKQLMSYSPYSSTDYSYDIRMSIDSSTHSAAYWIFNPPQYQAPAPQTSIGTGWFANLVQNTQQNTDVCSSVTPNGGGGSSHGGGGSSYWGGNSGGSSGGTGGTSGGGGNNPFAGDYCSSHSASFC